MQKVCRYPLLFAELYKHTPAVDDSASWVEIGKVLSRLREMAQEINKATNDRETQLKIRRSWYLQDMLIPPDVVSHEPLRLGVMLSVRSFRLQKCFRCAHWAIPHSVERFL